MVVVDREAHRHGLSAGHAARETRLSLRVRVGLPSLGLGEPQLSSGPSANFCLAEGQRMWVLEDAAVFGIIPPHAS